MNEFENNITNTNLSSSYKKMSKVRRDVGPLLQIIRERLLRRKNVNFLRFKDEMASRTQPPPNLPPGPHAKLAGNYYYTRDARRLVTQDEVLAEGGANLQLGSGSCEGTIAPVKRIPGRVYLWDM